MTDSEVAIAKLNNFIKVSAEAKVFETNAISDGYHTFGELYEHRIALFIALCSALTEFNHPWQYTPWKSKLHSDGTAFDGWFVAGIGKAKGQQITYHLPMDKWDFLAVEELDKAPEWDGHTPADVIKRLLEL